MDLLYIRKRILERAEFRVIAEATFQPKIEMSVYDLSIYVALSREEVQELSTQMDLSESIRNILLSEFIAQENYLKRFIQLENRERNLDELTNDEE